VFDLLKVDDAFSEYVTSTPIIVLQEDCGFGKTALAT